MISGYRYGTIPPDTKTEVSLTVYVAKSNVDVPKMRARLVSSVIIAVAMP